MQPGVGYRFISSSSGITLDIGDPWPENTVGPSKHPFYVTDLGPETVGGTLSYWFTVKPGTVNNLDPMIGGSAWFMTHMPVSDYEFVYYKFNFDPTTNYSYIVLKLGFDAATGEFPDSNTAHVSASPSYPVVDSLSYMPTTNNTDAYLVLARAYQDPTSKAITLNQYVTGSLWSLRVQYGSTPALYYYNRI
jgi:hypothetical protein